MTGAVESSRALRAQPTFQEYLMSPEVLDNIRLPHDAPASDKAKLMMRKFLSHHNRLDGYMAFMAVLWGTITLAFPGFWGVWPVSMKLAAWTGGHPEIVSWSLLLAGVGSYFSRWQKWTRMRAICALIAFSNWATLCALFCSVDPIYSPGVAVYGGLALAKLFSYINYILRLDAEARHEGAG
jgi:hypothetical protein